MNTSFTKFSKKIALPASVGAALILLAALPALAVETVGVPGSPSATTTIDGKQLPAPDPKFGGVIKTGCPAVESRGGHRASCPPRMRPTCC